MKRIRENKYFHFGTMLLGVIIIGMAILAVILHLEAAGRVLNAIGKAFSPLAFGLAFAYLLCPLMNFMNRRIYPLFQKKMPQERACKLSRALSLLFAFLCAAILIYEFFSMLLPQLYESLSGIVGNFSQYYSSVTKWIELFLASNPVVQEYVMDIVRDGYSMLKNWVSSGFLPSLETIVTGLTSSVLSVVGVLLNFVVGLCAAAYMLWSKETFMNQGKKLIVALCRESTADRLLELARRTHKIFSGFIIGKLLDSMIIGVLCYVGMLILKLPYPALIATVVGATNVIPFFGPFIGAVPSAVLILLVNPVQALYFILFVLGLQQLDGNIIGPRILGDSIGISGFWVLVSITVAGGLFGFAGMLLGVPVFAVLYMLAGEFIRSRLKQKGLPEDSQTYQMIQKVEDLSRTDPQK